MDDNRFDDIIKGKLDGYEDPSFDSAALAGFHSRMAAGFTPMPWYQQPLSHYAVAASLVFFTAVNAYLFWPSRELTPVAADTNHFQERVVIDSLSRVVDRMKTTYSIIVHERDSAVRLSLQKPMVTSSSPVRKQGPGVYLGQTAGIPQDLYHALLVKKMIVNDNGDAYLVAPDKSFGTYDRWATLEVKAVGEDYPWPQASFTIPELTTRPTVVASVKTEKKNMVSNKTRTLLEKHYMKGIGINVAPVAELSYGIFSSGEGSLNPRLGAAAEWVLSPSLSAETGLAYSTTSVRSESNFSALKLPDPDPSLGFVEAVQIKNYLASVPLAVKYRRWISEKGQAFVRAGYTPYYSFAQDYTFTYDFDRGVRPVGPPTGSGPDHHRVTSLQRVTDGGFYGGTGTLSLGFTRQMKNNNKLEASLFYEKSLSSVGREQLGLQLVGIRTAFWFNLR